MKTAPDLSILVIQTVVLKAQSECYKSYSHITITPYILPNCNTHGLSKGAIVP